MPLRHRRKILAALLGLLVVFSGIAGYVLGIGKAVSAAAPDYAACIEAFSQHLVVQNDLCCEIEAINQQQQLDQGAKVESVNLQEQLAQERDKVNSLNELLEAQKKELNDLLEAQKKELEIQKKESDDFESKILKSLMANLSEKLISRSSKSLSSYIQETDNLVTLSRKLQLFEKTPEAAGNNLSKYKAAIDSRLLRLPTLKPVPGVVDGYGWRIHPIYGNREFHAAADIGAPRGTPIRASASGNVIRASYNRSAGYFIEISHGNGFSSLYLHCSKLYVRAGKTVTKGDKIGLVGSTGASTVPHLHFVIRLNGKPINPSLMMREIA